MTNKEKLEYNKKAIDKEVCIISARQRGKIVDVKDAETFLVLIDDGKISEIREVDIFDIRYVS